MEADSYAPYRLISMVGYNCAQPEDLDKLTEAAEAGATVLIGWPQLSTTTNRADVLALQHEYLEHPFVTAVAGSPEFVEQHKNGLPVMVGPAVPTAEILETTDEGLPLIYRVPIGDGAVVFVNATCYAIDPALKNAWLRTLDRLTAETLEEEPVLAEVDENVQYTIYQQEDGTRHYYFLAVDWWNPKDTPHKAVLKVGDASYEIDVPWGVMLKVVTNGDIAAWCTSEDGEVLSVADDMVVVQGVDECDFCIVSGDAINTVTFNFDKHAIRTISL